MSEAELSDRSQSLCGKYSLCPSLLEVLEGVFGASKVEQFLEASFSRRRTFIRLNPHRVNALTTFATPEDFARYLSEKKGMSLARVEGLPHSYSVAASKHPVGATNEYVLGLYSLQDAASALPVLALAPQPGETVLDMCAAPGGKAVYIGDLMRNSGLLLCNDASLPRLKALTSNLARCGLTNAVVTNIDATDPRALAGLGLGRVDRVLLDAPCTGLGVLGKDLEIGMKRDKQDIKRRAVLQKKLILNAIDLLKVNGVLVYSTCSVSVHENEDVVNYALQKRKVKLRKIGVEGVGRSGFVRKKNKIYSETLRLCRRVYPHVEGMNGFFVAKIEKLG